MNMPGAWPEEEVALVDVEVEKESIVDKTGAVAVSVVKKPATDYTHLCLQ